MSAPMVNTSAKKMPLNAHKNSIRKPPDIISFKVN